MRKVVKGARLMARPLPVIRFDNEDWTEHLIFPNTTRGAMFSKGTVAKHA
jgi:hypothetical protein